jgi:hypothetical protein
MRFASKGQMQGKSHVFNELSYHKTVVQREYKAAHIVSHHGFGAAFRSN